MKTIVAEKHFGGSSPVVSWPLAVEMVREAYQANPPEMCVPMYADPFLATLDALEGPAEPRVDVSAVTHPEAQDGVLAGLTAGERA